MTKNRGGNNGSEKWIEKTTAAFRNLGNELNACVVRDEMERIWQKVTVTYLSVVCHVLGSDSYNSNEKTRTGEQHWILVVCAVGCCTDRASLQPATIVVWCYSTEHYSRMHCVGTGPGVYSSRWRPLMGFSERSQETAVSSGFANISKPNIKFIGPCVILIVE